MIIDIEKITLRATERHRAFLTEYFGECTAAEIETKLAEQTEEAAKYYEEEYSIALETKKAEVKAKHPKAHMLTVEGKYAFLQPMDRKVLSMAQTLGGLDDVKIVELLLDALWIEGDEEIKVDDDYFIPAISQIKDLMKVKTATLVKL